MPKPKKKKAKRRSKPKYQYPGRDKYLHYMERLFAHRVGASFMSIVPLDRPTKTNDKGTVFVGFDFGGAKSWAKILKVKGWNDLIDQLKEISRWT